MDTHIKYLLIAPFILLAGYFIIRFFYLKQREKEPLSKVILTVIFGALIVVFAYYAEKFFDNFIGLTTLVKDKQELLPTFEIVSKVVFMLLFVGFIEELSKLLAALPVYLTREFNRVRDGMFYMVLAGLGFGLAEDFLYIERVGFWGVIFRLLFGVLFHPAASGLIGFYIGKARLKLCSWMKVVLVVLGVMLLHGLYDISIILNIEAIAPIATAIALLLYGLIFILYNEAEKIDREMGLEKSSMYNFCPRCGQVNYNKDFCTRCGRSLLKK